MKSKLALLLLLCFAFAQSPAQTDSPLNGAWSGALNVPPGIKLRLIFHVSSSTGELKATMDSVDQNARGIPVTAVSLKGSKVVFDLPNIGGRYEGTIDKETITGSWSQGGNSLPLVLTRAKSEQSLQLIRPQEPKHPYPYVDEEVSYANVQAGIRLAATLTMPRGKGPFPAVVLITGSGPQDRDEAIMGHKPFLVLSDYLTRHGIAVLRADDRGIGKSGGVFATATTADFATDAEAGVAYLKTRKEIDPHKIGLIGHSEGGIIAPMVASRSPDLAFIVMLAGPGVRGADVVVEQVRLMNAASGMAPQKNAEVTSVQRDIVDLFLQEKDDAEFARKVRERFAGKLSQPEIDTAILRGQGPWARYFISYDPATALRKVTCPVLAMIGDKDTQVSAAQNLGAIRAALKAAGNKDYEAIEMKNLNHLFQEAKTGSPSEYGEIEQTMSPVALSKIASWIQTREAASTGGAN
jgi:uncharacterized protein